MEIVTSVFEIAQLAEAAVASLSVDGKENSELMETLQDELSMTIERWGQAALEAATLEDRDV